MKNCVKLLMAAVLIVAATANANAQFGIKAGYVNSVTKIQPQSGSVTIKSKGQSGFYAGVNYDIALSSSGLSLRPGVTYTYIGGDSYVASVLSLLYMGDITAMPAIKERDHTLGVPVDFVYGSRLPNGLRLYVFAGPRFDVGLSSIISIKGDGESETINLYTGEVKLNGQQLDVLDLGEGPYTRFNLQLGIGAGIQFRNWSCELGYDFGLTNRLKSDFRDGGERLKRNKFVVGIGYYY
jgi:hypothetical protein